MKKILLPVFLLFLGCGNSNETTSNSANTINGTVPTNATYKITFTTLWNTNDHASVPENAHFSPIIAATHNEQYVLFAENTLSGKGLELVAETGTAAELNKEIQREVQNETVLTALNTQNQFINSQLTQSFEITVTNNFPLLSLVSMIAPSPDWIVGVDSLSLYSKELGFIKTTSSVDLYAYNAGTESGDFAGNYSINNTATNPQQPISLLAGPGFSKPFAKVTIEFVK
ncbi:MAG: spondin domain-containing protein [Bdellovibrionaceae bacterium]|nr:spondin domain-containing protein [Pseudobdellovibrionaceae bacterium]